MLAIQTLKSNQTVFTREVKLLGTRFEISVVADSSVWAEDRMDQAMGEIGRIEKLLSTFNEDSIINHINRNAGVKPVKVDAEIFGLIDRSVKIAELTDGVFDITYSAEGKANSFNYRNIVLDPANTTVFLKDKGMRIGFGAISKGYAADRAKYILQMTGVRSGVINAGGDLLTWGLQPNDQPWTIAAADAAQPVDAFGHLNISNMAVATSGNVERYAMINGEPAEITETGSSLLKRVSIISPTAEFADALATPIMRMGINAGLSLINRLHQLACVITDENNHTYTSKAIAALS